MGFPRYGAPNEILDTQTFSSKFQNLKPNYRILVMILVSRNVRYMRLFARGEGASISISVIPVTYVQTLNKNVVFFLRPNYRTK